MEILYEPYHIGIKLHPYTNLDILKERLKKELGRRGYEIPREIVTEPIKIGPPEEIIGIKEDTQVVIRRDLQALNTRGTSPMSVSSVFKEITDLLPNLGYELDALVQFYEIIATMNIKTSKKPVEILKKAIRIRRQKMILRTLGKVKILGVHIGVERKGRVSMDLIIEPNPTSPTSRLWVKVRFRSKNKAEVETFHEELEKNIREMIEFLEGA